METKVNTIRELDAEIAKILGWSNIQWLTCRNASSEIDELQLVGKSEDMRDNRLGPVPHYHTWQYGYLCLEFAKREWRDKNSKKWEKFQLALWSLRSSRYRWPNRSSLGFEEASDYATALLATINIEEKQNE